LDLPPQQRWVDISKTYKAEVNALITYIKGFIIEFSPKFKELIALIENDLAPVADTLPAPYGDEIKGIATAVDMSLGDVVLYNIFYEVFTLCTSIIGVDVNGNTMHARNLDFGLFLGWDLKNDTWQLSELLRPLIVDVEYTRGGVVQYKTVTFVGFVGLINGVKPGVMSLSINERFGVYGGYIGLFEWFFNLNRNQAWITLIARDVLDQNITYDQAIQKLTDTPLIAPVYYIAASAEKGKVILF
jgi:acid ceramidase